ncbi:hypothetical protein HDU77_001623 [Chytriomyces hyalinus]|nr:hypothetical protein HDU77_001623 [Chytriomyces hyalinus]
MVMIIGALKGSGAIPSTPQSLELKSMTLTNEDLSRNGGDEPYMDILETINNFINGHKLMDACVKPDVHHWPCLVGVGSNVDIPQSLINTSWIFRIIKTGIIRRLQY